jgi:adenylate cyclase
MERHIAAILSADVVGYGRLMEADEAGTLAVLKARRRDILEPLVAKYRGRVFKVTGDGVLVEFASAVNAVQCAVDLQQGMSAANGDQPEDRHIILRVGVNLGDVMTEGGDLYGDGVNIAARLETIAEPGTIVISGTAYDQVKNKVKVAFDDLGTQTLKNMAQPVRVYRVAGTPSVTVAAPQPTTDRPSIAVLPFTNMSGDPEQEYFSDGITEDIITELSRFRQLSVIARHSSFQFRDKAADVKRVGRQLGIQYVVEGSVRRFGDRIRISAQLVDTISGNQLWGERFDRDQKDIFTVQDQITRTIVATLVGRLEAAGAEQARRKPPTSLAAYECVLRGKALPLGNLQSEAEKRRMYERAIELDPDYGHAYALLALAIFLEWFRDMTGPDVALDRALGLAKKAVALDENDTTCQYVIGWMYLHRKSFDLAEQYYRRALELNPNNAEQVARMGFLCANLGKPDEAIDWLKQAQVLDRHLNPTWYWHMLGYAHFVAHKYEEAIAAYSRSSTMPFWVQAYLAACYALTDRVDQAREFAANVLRLAPDFSSTRLAGKEPFKRPADRDHLLDGLRKAGLPE